MFRALTIFASLPLSPMEISLKKVWPDIIEAALFSEDKSSPFTSRTSGNSKRSSQACVQGFSVAALVKYI